MRDLAIASVLPFLIYFSYKRPFIGISLWLWTSLININAIVFGFASSITFVKLFTGVTLLSLLKSKEKHFLKFDALTILIILFYIVATLSNIDAIGNPDFAWNRWEVYTKILIFYFFAIKIISEKIHIDLLIWVTIISIGAMASMEGAKFIVSGGSHRIGELAGIQGDNNFFGVMIVTVLPLAAYLVSQTEHKTLRMGLILVIVLMIMGIFSTFSRGAFLGLSAFALFFWKSSKRKILWAGLLFFIVFALNNLMPEEWLSRMHSSENADKDSSFMGRVMAWKIATLVALDHPLGGGFDCVINVKTWAIYGAEFYKLDFIPTPPAPGYGFMLATHSMYFQVLSNHGFIGLALFILILFSVNFKLSRILRFAKKNNAPIWIIMLTKMLKLSMLSYCLSGAAVNVAYMDLLYGIFVITSILDTKIIHKVASENSILVNLNNKKS